MSDKIFKPTSVGQGGTFKAGRFGLERGFRGQLTKIKSLFGLHAKNNVKDIDKIIAPILRGHKSSSVAHISSKEAYKIRRQLRKMVYDPKSDFTSHDLKVAADEIIAPLQKGGKSVSAIKIEPRKNIQQNKVSYLEKHLAAKREVEKNAATKPLSSAVKQNSQKIKPPVSSGVAASGLGPSSLELEIKKDHEIPSGTTKVIDLKIVRDQKKQEEEAVSDTDKLNNEKEFGFIGEGGNVYSDEQWQEAA